MVWASVLHVLRSKKVPIYQVRSSHCVKGGTYLVWEPTLVWNTSKDRGFDSRASTFPDFFCPSVCCSGVEFMLSTFNSITLGWKHVSSFMFDIFS